MQGALFDGDPRRAPEAVDLDELYTPDYIFAPLHREFRFTVDACAASARCARVKRFWSPAQDGIAQSWKRQRVWLNPPYSCLGAWVAKAHREMLAAAVLVAGLFPATRSEQPFWQEFIEPYRDLPRHKKRVADGPKADIVRCAPRRFTIETRNIGRRIAFEGPSARFDTGKFPSVLVIWRAVG